MALRLWGRVFSKPLETQETERHAGLQQALDAGPPSLWERLLSPFQPHPWLLELKRRRHGVHAQYLARKRHLVAERHHAERALKSQLQRHRADIERYYRLHELTRGDPRLVAATRKSHKKVALYERQAWRQFRRQWRERLRQMQKERDQQYRQAAEELRSKSMTGEV